MIFLLGWVFILCGIALYGVAAFYSGNTNPNHKDFGPPLLPGFFSMILGVALLFFHYHPILGLLGLAGLGYTVYHMIKRHGL